jgi:hypothetical protein
MIHIIFFVFVALCAIDAHGFFSYDKAASLMEQGKYLEAKQQLQKLLIDKPDAPDILYDAGVASYHTKDYNQSRAYFNRVTTLPQTTIQLKEQAHFNAGNAAAAMKQYEDAIKHYELTLDINKNNEKAKHNLAATKELMKRKQEQKKEKDSKDKNENKNQENKDQKEEQSSQEQQDKGSEDKKGKEENNRQDEREKEQNKDSQNQKEQNEKEQEQQSAEAEQNERGKDSQGKQEQQVDKNKQKQEDHAQAPNQQGDTKQHDQGTGAAGKEQGKAQDAAGGDQEHTQSKLDARLAQILEAQEKKDAALNKRMVNAVVGHSMGGTQGENCW